MAEGEDEDILDSWEDAADTDLERRMEEREKTLLADSLEEKDNGNLQNKILLVENSSRTTYSPQIKILKRSKLENATANKPVNKTEAELKESLKLREAEYKAARNRIMGENYDETRESLDNKDDTKVSNVCNQNGHDEKNSPQHPIRLLSPTEKLKSISKVEDSIERQPNGPDKNPGFNIVR